MLSSRSFCCRPAMMAPSSSACFLSRSRCSSTCCRASTLAASWLVSDSSRSRRLRLLVCSVLRASASEARSAVSAAFSSAKDCGGLHQRLMFGFELALLLNERVQLCASAASAHPVFRRAACEADRALPASSVRAAFVRSNRSLLASSSLAVEASCAARLSFSWLICTFSRAPWLEPGVQKDGNHHHEHGGEKRDVVAGDPSRQGGFARAGCGLFKLHDERYLAVRTADRLYLGRRVSQVRTLPGRFDRPAEWFVLCSRISRS